jgi:hypothetical protein
MPLNVRQSRGRDAVLRDGGAELGHHDGPGHPVVGGDAQREAGVIIEPGQDLGAASIGERVVGEVGLPAFIRQLGGEPDIGGAGPLGRFGGDQPGPGQIPADGGFGDPDAVGVLQVPGNGGRPGVQTRAGQVLAQPHDQLCGRVRDGPRRCPGAP